MNCSSLDPDYSIMLYMFSHVNHEVRQYNVLKRLVEKAGGFADYFPLVST